MVHSREQTPHQFSRIEAVPIGLKRYEQLCRTQAVLTTIDNTSFVAYINKERGGKSGLFCPALETSVLMQPEEYCPKGAPHPRLVECDCRRANSPQSGDPAKMVSSPVDLRPGLKKVPQTPD